MDRRKRWLWRGAAIGAAVLLATVTAIAIYAPGASAAAGARELSRAEQRWAARRLSSYRLVLQAASWCRTDVEVRGEQVTRVFESTCLGAPRTVGELFDRVRQLAGDDDQIFCAPNGCECTEQRFVRVDYDPQLGFPYSIRVRRVRETNWQGLWGYVLEHGLPNCLTPPDLDVVRVLSLRPVG